VYQSLFHGPVAGRSATIAGMSAPSLRTATVASLAAVPGLVHGFERRRETAGPESREETRSRVTASLAPYGALLLLQQVHGASVVEAPWEGTPAADAGVSGEPGWLVGIETADCLPLLLVDPRRRAIAAAHAGWRGTAAQVAAGAVAALVARGSQPSDLLAALGPCIGPCCYEVGEELRGAFGEDAPHVFRPLDGARPHLDLRAANARQLARAGLRPGAIAHVEECTRCSPGLYHSYRREGRGAGRMISFVGFARGLVPAQTG
jgi:YfiH family protein